MKRSKFGSAHPFGDPFVLEQLLLPRPADGYAVQLLGTDRILDRCSGDFLPVRHPMLDGLFSGFAQAECAAFEWFEAEACNQNGAPGELSHRHPDPSTVPVSIVPASYDKTLERHVLIYGMLQAHP